MHRQDAEVIIRRHMRICLCIHCVYIDKLHLLESGPGTLSTVSFPRGVVIFLVGGCGFFVRYLAFYPGKCYNSIYNTKYLSTFMFHFNSSFQGPLFGLYILHRIHCICCLYKIFRFFFPNSVNRIREKTGVGRWLSYCSLIL